MAVIDIPNKIQKIIYKRDFSEYVLKYSQMYNVDENLVYALIKAESNFHSDVKSSKGAIGLMQLMEDTAKDVVNEIDIEINLDEISDMLLDSEFNINLGTKYLSILLNRYQNIELSVAAYNAGIGTVDNWIKEGIIKEDGSDIENIPYKETNNYVRKILRDYKVYQELY